MDKNLVSTKEVDYLDEDPPIRGQKYCCLSFISPEEVIRNKEVFMFNKFLGAFSKDVSDLFSKSKDTFKEFPEFVNGLKGIEERYSYLFGSENLSAEYEFFKGAKSDALETEYLEKNDFQTTIRGFKVRGSYESLKEAQIRAQMLKRMDDKFNVFVAAVGCWCPWSPNPEELENQEYAESHLNTLVKKYLDNQKDKDEFFLQRKETLRQNAMDENEEKKKLYKVEEEKEELVESEKPVSEVVESLVEEVVKGLEDDDPWQQRVKEKQVELTNDTTDNLDIQDLVRDKDEP